MSTIQAILLGGFPLVALATVVVVFYLNKDRFFAEVNEAKK